MNIRKIKKKIKDPSSICLSLGYKGFFNWLSDETYLKLLYLLSFRRKLNITNPQTYNEKLQWLKLYDRNPLYTKLVDKFEVREYVKEKIGEEYLIPLLGVWDRFDDINFDYLPNSFVIKCTHDSGGVFVCEDRNKIDIKRLKSFFDKRLSRNYYWAGREWNYKNIKPRIIIEEYMKEQSSTGIIDYKFFCFNGEPKAMFIATDRSIGKTKFDFFDINFNRLPVKQHYENSQIDFEKPKAFEDMVRLARILSRGISHVRVDFYFINGRVYFGELTFAHFSGFKVFVPDEYDQIFGDWLILPIKKNIE